MIEVMVAVLLTAIAAAGIVGLYMVETRASGFSRHMTEATVLAQDQLERMRTSGVTGTGSTASLNELGKVVSGGLYTRSWSTAVGTPASFEDLTVTVSWPEDGVTKNVTLRARRNVAP